VFVTKQYFLFNFIYPWFRYREYGRRYPSRWPRGTICSQKLELTSPTSSGRSVGVVRSRNQASEFFFHFTYTIRCFSVLPKKSWVRLSALRTGRTLLRRNIVFLLLVLISANSWLTLGRPEGLRKFKNLIHLIRSLTRDLHSTLTTTLPRAPPPSLLLFNHPKFLIPWTFWNLFQTFGAFDKFLVSRLP
jgi:hypothetical protein